MIELSSVTMRYPLPVRYRQLAFGPFARRPMKTALGGVSLSVGPGERVGFMGPNGAGKTTLLKLVAGLLLPTEGRVRVNGHDTLADDGKARRSVSMVLNDERSFYWRLTARENLEFFGALENLGGKPLKRKIAELLELVGLADQPTAMVGTFSSGMKQRLALARGLLSDPDTLILDEPTRALDPGAAREFSTFLVENLAGDLAKTLLVATHSLEEARALCTRLCVVAGGRVRADAPMADIVRDYPDVMDFYAKGVGA